jgi:sugar phosphate isomerase/epimerase
VENVERLGARVDDIELLLFQDESEVDLPDRDEIAALVRLKEEHDLSFTVHTPLGVQLASPEPDIRRKSIERILRVVGLCEPLEPFAYIVHVYLGAQENDPHRPVAGQSWKRWARDGLCRLAAATGTPEKVCVESLDYDLAVLEDLLDEFGLSVALDVGHLVRDGRDTRASILRWLPKTRVVHWHGTDPSGRDHRGLEHFPPAQGRWLLQTLQTRGFGGVLTIEVFRSDDWESSLRVLGQLSKEIR